MSNQSQNRDEKNEIPVLMRRTLRAFSFDEMKKIIAKMV